MIPPAQVGALVGQHQIGLGLIHFRGQIDPRPENPQNEGRNNVVTDVQPVSHANGHLHPIHQANIAIQGIHGHRHCPCQPEPGQQRFPGKALSRALGRRGHRLRGDGNDLNRGDGKRPNRVGNPFRYQAHRAFHRNGHRQPHRRQGPQKAGNELRHLFQEGPQQQQGQNHPTGGQALPE